MSCRALILLIFLCKITFALLLRPDRHIIHYQRYIRSKEDLECLSATTIRFAIGSFIKYLSSVNIFLLCCLVRQCTCRYKKSKEIEQVK